MNWQSLRVSVCGTHHVDQHGQPRYGERFDEVLAFHPPGLAPVRRTGQAWHVRSDGASAYDRRFVRTFGYYEGLASVVTSDGWWFHITSDGEDAYIGRHAWCGNFQQGRCSVRDCKGAYHHIRLDGSAAYEERWCYAGDFRDGIAVVQANDGYSTHIDRDGQLVHAKWFLDLDVFHKGLARARDEGGWTHIDIRGKAAYPRRFQVVEPFYNGQARVELFNGTLEIIDEGGATTVTLRPPLRSEFEALSGDMVGFWRTQTIGAAVGLGIIEGLPATESEVAERCRLTGEGALRILRALGELDLVDQRGGKWTLTPRGEYLRADHPLTLCDAALEYAGPFSAMWHELPNALSKGSDWTAPDVFGQVARDDARRIGHHRMLQSYARHDYAEVCRALELRGDECVIDAGGGLGTLGQLIREEHPSSKVTILERPEVVAMAKSSLPGLHWCAGSLFTSWGVGADVVLLSRVLHDWDDGKAIQILENARAALSAGGRVFLIEMLIPEGEVAGALCDLHLLMATGGRERSEVEYEYLLSEAGFRLNAVRRLAAVPSVIEGEAV